MKFTFDIILRLVILCILVIINVVFLIFWWAILFSTDRDWESRIHIWQTCLSAPNSQGCTNCLAYGYDGEMYNRCEDLYENEEKRNDSTEKIYFEQYCQNNDIDGNFSE